MAELAQEAKRAARFDGVVPGNRVVGERGEACRRARLRRFGENFEGDRIGREESAGAEKVGGGGVVGVLVVEGEGKGAVDRFGWPPG